MTEDLHNIDNLFKSGIEGYEETPSPSTWNAIDKELDNNNFVNGKKDYILIKQIAVLLILLFTGSITHDLKNRKQADKSIAIVNKDTQLISSSGVNKSGDSKTAFITLMNKTATRDIAKQTNLGRNTIHNFVKVKKRHSINPNYEEPSELVNGENTSIEKNINSKENISSNQNVLGILDVLPRQAFLHSTFTDLSFQPLELQNDHFPKISIVNKSITPNIKASMQKMPHLSVAFFFSPNIASDRLLSDGDDDDHTNKIRKGEHSQSSFSLGTLIEYKLNKHWSIQSGVTFLDKVNKINPQTIYAQNTGNGNVAYRFECSSGYSYLSTKLSNPISVGDSAQASSTTNTLQYIGIPLEAKYIIPKGKFNLNALMGVSFNILTKGNIETEIENSSAKENEVVNKISGLKSGYISSIIGVGIEYQLTKRLAFTFDPSMNIALTSITQGAPVKSFPSFVSFAAGLHIDL